MNTQTRIDIIAPEVAFDALHRTLGQLNAPGYSLIRGVTGRGPRGVLRDDEIAEGGASVLVMVICPRPLAEQIAAGIRPTLDRFGGICTLATVESPERG